MSSSVCYDDGLSASQITDYDSGATTGFHERLNDSFRGSALSRTSSCDSTSSGNTSAVRRMQDSPEGSSVRMKRLKDAILASARSERKLKKNRTIFRGDKGEGKAQRKRWLALEKELHRVQGLASWSVQEIGTESLSRLLHNLCDSVAEACYFLIEGDHFPFRSSSSSSEPNPFGLISYEALEHTDLTGEPRLKLHDGLSKAYDAIRHPRYNVWPSIQAARTAIMQESVAAVNTSCLSRGSTAKPLVVLVVEKASEGDGNRDTGSEADGQEHMTPNLEQQSFLLGWTNAGCGIAELITVVAGSSEKIRSGVEAVLNGISNQKRLSPVLVCLHANMSSITTSHTGSLRTICDSFGAYFCVEGSALAMTAQPGRPSDPEECVSKAHTMIIDPGMWFGFKMCAIITRHQARIGRRHQSTEGCRYERFHTSVSKLSSSEDNQNLTMGPVLNLWTVLSRIGVRQIRPHVDEMTAVAETFLHMFESSPNIHVTYEGIGCVIRISYALSREEGLISQKKAAHSISMVNDTIYSNLLEESQQLMIQKVRVEDTTYLHFSPSRILRSGTFWTPDRERVRQYATKVQEIVDRYESCKAGLVAFEGKVAKCRDLELVTREEGGSSLTLCFGAFRVVPFELSTSWREAKSSTDVVSHLTNQLVSKLGDYVRKVISSKSLLRRELEGSRYSSSKSRHGRNAMRGPYLDGVRSENNSTNAGIVCEGRHELPLIFFLNSELDNGIQDFISIEPREACRPVDAVRKAGVAAELAIAAVDAVTSQWRNTNMISEIPRDLANTTGKEGFIPLTTSRDGLGCVDYISAQYASRHCEKSCVEYTNESSSCSDDSIFADTDDESFSAVQEDVLRDATENVVSPKDARSHADGNLGSQNEAGKEDFGCDLEPTHGVNVLAANDERATNQTNGDDISQSANISRGEKGSNRIAPGSADGTAEVAVCRNDQSLRVNDGNQAKSNWLGFLSSAAGTKRSSRENSSRNQRANDDSGRSSSEGHVNRTQRGAGGADDSGGNSPSSSDSENSDDDDSRPEKSPSSSDSEDSEDNSDESEETESTRSDSSGEEMEDSHSDSDSTDRAGLSAGMTEGSSSTNKSGHSGYRSTFFSWLTGNRAALTNANKLGAEGDSDVEVGGEDCSDDDDVDTQLSDVPTEWASRQAELHASEEFPDSESEALSSSDSGSIASSQRNESKNSSGANRRNDRNAFGMTWLRHHYFKSAAETKHTQPESNSISRSSDEDPQGVESQDESANESFSDSFIGSAQDLQSVSDEIFDESEGSDSSAVSQCETQNVGSDDDYTESEDDDAESQVGDDDSTTLHRSESVSHSSEASKPSDEHSESEEIDESGSELLQSGSSKSRSVESDCDSSEHSLSKDETGAPADSYRSHLGRTNEAGPRSYAISHYMSWLIPRWSAKASTSTRHPESEDESYDSDKYEDIHTRSRSATLRSGNTRSRK